MKSERALENSASYRSSICVIVLFRNQSLRIACPCASQWEISSPHRARLACKPLPGVDPDVVGGRQPPAEAIDLLQACGQALRTTACGAHGGRRCVMRGDEGD